MQVEGSPSRALSAFSGCLLRLAVCFVARAAFAFQQLCAFATAVRFFFLSQEQLHAVLAVSKA